MEGIHSAAEREPSQGESSREIRAPTVTPVRAGGRSCPVRHRADPIAAPPPAPAHPSGAARHPRGTERGRPAIFVCDRTTLIDQTSAVTNAYGLSAHGMIEADHSRTPLSYRFQIASAQTLARRGWPEADVIVVGESSARASEGVDRAHQNMQGDRGRGLSATPFSRGLGKLFSNCPALKRRDHAAAHR